MRCDEIGQAAAGAHLAVGAFFLHGLLAQALPGQYHVLARLVGVERDVIVGQGLAGQKPTTACAVSQRPVLIRPGIYQAGTQFLNKWIGQVNQPITILAESSGQVIFRGGTESMHLSQCAYVHIIGLIIEQQTGNGLNIDDGGVYTQPSKHIHIRGCIFRDMSASGNNDLLKLSGLDSFLISDNMFINGSAGGSGIEMVGCHHGTIEDNYFDRAGVTGLQAKGGTQFLNHPAQCIQRYVSTCPKFRGYRFRVFPTTFAKPYPQCF